MTAVTYYFFKLARVAIVLAGSFLLYSCSPVTDDLLAQAEPPPEDERPVLDVRSPFDIERFINANPKQRIGSLWSELGIAGQFNGLPGLEADARDFFMACHYCEAEAARMDLDEEPEEEVVLRVEDRLSETSRYLVFKLVGGGGHRLIGHIDHNFGRYMMPSHSAFALRGRTYLLVSAQTQSGSGVARYVKRLFTVREGRLEELLWFPAEGHQSTIDPVPQREFFGRLVDVVEEKDLTRVTLQLTVKYTLPGREGGGASRRWTKMQKAVYMKRSDQPRAVLDKARSDLTQAEIDAVYDIDTLTDADLIKYNRKELRAAGWRPPRN